MMELPCVFVFTLAGLVAGNPYGYGVKGGAGAKADANAVAGAFGGLGNIPSGGAFSGSFSKSSATSFASSSASSSSSSFSYSGAGNAGLTGTGCTSGGCQKGLGGGLSPDNTGSINAGSGFPTQSGAGAVAIAGASAGSYSHLPGNTPCTGGDCAGQKSSGCQGSSCGDLNKCSSGQCKTSSSLTNGESEDNTNDDIRVNVAGTAASKTNSDAHSTQYDKAANGYHAPTSGCSSGNCGSSTNLNPSYPHANFNQGPGFNNLKPNCNTPHCNDNPQSGQSSINTPSAHLTTPKEYPNPGTGRLPLSYETADSQNAYLSPAADKKDSRCSSEKCNNNQPEGAYNPVNGNSYTSNYLGTTLPNTEEKNHLSDNVCKFGNCASPPQTYNKESSKSPNYSRENCASGNCGSYPSPTPTHASAITYSDSKIPSYSQAPSGLGGSCASGNCGSYPSSAPTVPGATTYTGAKIPSYSQAPSNPAANCASGNCGGYPTPAPSAPSTIYSGTKLPNYSQAPLSPAVTCTSGNCGSYPSLAPNPTSGSTYPSYNIPNYSQPPSSAAGNCASGNCGSYPSSSPSLTGSSTHTSTRFPSVSQGSSPTFSITGPTAPTNCGTSNCAQNPGPNPKPSIVYTPPFTSSSPGYHNNAVAGANAGASTAVSKPSSDLYPSSEEKLPTYTGGFGGPSGILKPNQYSLPSKPVVYPVGQAPTSPTTYLGASAIPSTLYGVAPTSAGLSKPGSCTSGNCGSQPVPSYGSSNLIKSDASASAGASASASANAVVYSGGFGGPPGLLKPYDEGKTDGSLGSAGKPNSGYQNAVRTGNYGSGTAGTNSPYSGSGSGGHTGSTGSGGHLPYGNIGAGSGSQAGAGAHAAAVGGAAAGGFNGSYNHDNGIPAGGCRGGCGGSPHGGGHHFGVGGGISGAFAKSIAGGTSGAGAGAYGQAGSFASSSASAHASAGFPTKGGYGK